MRIFSPLFECARRKKGFFIFLIIATLAVAVFGVFSAINFDGGILSFDLSNVPYISYLRGDSGLVALIFGMLFSVFLFYAAIILFSSKGLLFPLAMVFYFYLVYSQTMILTCIILFYGFLNILVLLIFLLVFILLEFLLFIIILCELINFTNCKCYLKNCYSPNQSCLLVTSILLSALIVVLCFVLMILKSFVILLVFGFFTILI